MTNNVETYTTEEVMEASLEYFNGDELAASSVVKKYLLRDLKGNYLEKTPADMHHRLCSEFTRIEKKFGGSRALTYDEIYSQLDHFKKIVPQGSPMFGIGNNHAIVSLSNCVVVSSPEDDVSSIVNQGKDLANLFKRRCGVGIDITPLRPDGMPVSNSAGTTTGAWSYADFYSYICRMIGQNGRRGALMISIDVRHPDIEKFITMKSDLEKVTGANVSIRIRDDFMEAVEADQDFVLRWPVEGSPKITRIIRARDLWNKIVLNATNTAEPGLLMWDNILKELPAQCYWEDGFETVTTNPCGEIPLSPYDSCRLIAINLTQFVKNPYTLDAYFDFDEFSTTARIGQRLSDDLIELEIEKLQSILNKVDTEDERILWAKLLEACVKGRRTGLGTLGLGDTLARLCVPYDSEEGLVITDKIYETLKVGAYTESVELAKERCPFPVWSWEKEKNNAYLNRLPKQLLEKMSVYGRRNISLLTNAPAGTSSICAQTSSGIEPIWRLEYTRRKKIGHNDQNLPYDFIDSLGDKWQNFEVYHHEYANYLKTVGTKDVPIYFVTSDKIDWEKRVDMQAVIQRHIDHSISSTINLPAGTVPSVVDTLYRRSWKKGLKGVTVYVDGSRTGVLIEKNSTKDNKAVIQYKDAPTRPNELKCEVHHHQVKGEKWTILVGMLEDKPYEVFAGPSSAINIPNSLTEGMLVKTPDKGNSRYDLLYGDSKDIKNIVSWFENNGYGTMSRMVSMSLRHGVPIQFIVEQLQKDPNDDMWSFNRVLARVLKKFIQNGTKRKKTCAECGDTELAYEEGCLRCVSCGYVKCS